MKIKNVVILLLLMFLGATVMASTVGIAVNEPTPMEFVEETAESEGSESMDELKLFHHKLHTDNTSQKSLHYFGETVIVLKTISQGLYRPPKLS